MMSDDMLSQDEIDALLGGIDEEPLPSSTISINDVLTPIEQDALGEIGNISFGSSATALSMLLNQKVEITTPSVSLIERARVAEEFPHPYVAIQVSYTEGFLGTNLLVIEQSDAAIIADLMMGGDGTNPPAFMDDIQLSAVQEAMNQMMGSAATSMSTIFSKKVDISPPSIHLLDLSEGEGLEYLPSDDMLVKVSFRLKVGELIDSSIMQLLPIHFAKELVENLLNRSSTSTPTSDKINTNEQRQEAQHVSSKTTSVTTQQVQKEASQHDTTGVMQQPINVQPVAFASFEPTSLSETEARNLDMLLDIPLQVTVELGRTKRSVRDILALSSGSIIELDKLAGEPVDILVNNKLIAKGEVVVIDENFGVRVTSIISQSDRLNKLR
ncbi:flagellar motor switch protein FliN [Anoxybacillus gonensis]|uniref:Flagellar motor switch phosphatase FliY n=1 Tax=Anoxybacillus gonensis TaxID=198467 RepID=A0AAW7TD69_9BACL|nr:MULTISPECIES: flagellar motor switch phosphatase FliY [Anoxybacillus]AXM87877.1 flagellar motor switch phosphatase FliY [Anoxybacillus ayderensis G10]AKS38056.1 flagellar motor switch protein FliN [Anoxybacillus gonensis]KGP60881.1 flagellar motor switch protein FliN [Anoxybacillus gonensis]MBW9217015.1 flagellar motor switch phosphatase FliY [Anoxybacillus sp. ST70]MCX8045361.1 flagellar motor switch phosphatase FliY [Anoxybacillus gonensis]